MYGLGLLIWIYAFEDDIKYYDSESSIGIKYLWLITIPSVLLIGQAIFNNRIIWGIIIGLVGAYSVWALWNFFFLNVLINYHKDYIPKRNWPFTDIFWFLVLFLVFFSINWVIWKIKPNKKHFAQHGV